MLVLSRKVGESIVIDGRIRVTVIEVDRGRIRLGSRHQDRCDLIEQKSTMAVR